MRKLEYFFIIAVIGPVLPIFLFMTGWWVSLIFSSDNVVFVYALIGLGVGCLADIIFFRQIIKSYWWDLRILAVVYLFYSVCFIGFFMGVPVFNIALGAIAGVYMGRRFYNTGLNKEHLQNASTSFALFSALIMVFASLASAYFATKDIRDTALNLQGMFRLRFLPTNQAIIALIIFGGIALVLVQYWIAKKFTIWAYRKG